MKTRRFSYKFDDLGITRGDIEKFIGYERGSSSEPVSTIIGNSLTIARDLCSVRGTLVFADDILIDDQASAMTINRTSFDLGKIILAQIRRSESVAFFVCTAGPRIAEACGAMSRAGDDLEAYVLDAVGSEVVESAMDRIQDELESEMHRSGSGITDRYSPGYCGWPVAEQRQLFSMFAGIETGVTLTESAVMEPIKSVSGIIGIGPGLRRTGYTCHACEMTNCIYRKKKS